MTGLPSRRHPGTGLLAPLWALALGLGLFAPSAAWAQQELSLGVYLPQASFATNAERSAWADRLAADLTERSEGALSVRAQVFARREDAQTFAGRIDLLVTDGLFAVTQSAEAIAHASLTPAVALYALDVDTVGALEGKVVGAAEVGPAEAAFYANTVLAGELVADRFFAELRPFTNSAAALNAVKSRTVAAAFAHANHPAGAGLKVIATGGSYPVAVVLVTNKAKIDPVRDRLTKALAGLPVGALGAMVAGGGDALARARQARGAPRVMTSPALLTGGADQRPVPPPIRLRARGKIPTPELGSVPLATPALAEPP